MIDFETLDDEREVARLANEIIRRGIHSKEDLIDALRLRKLIKQAQEAKFTKLAHWNDLLMRFEAVTHPCDAFLDEPLHPVRPNIRRGSINVDGKVYNLVETTRKSMDNEQVYRLWKHGLV